MGVFKWIFSGGIGHGRCGFGDCLCGVGGGQGLAGGGGEFRAAADLGPNHFTKEGFGALIHRWGANVPVTTGCPVRRICRDGPGRAGAGARAALRQPVGGRILVAGEAVAGDGLMQTTTGARLSGAGVGAEVAATPVVRTA